MSKNKVVKPVSLNTTKEEDAKILSFIANLNFSGYVKELILADIDKRNQPLRIVQKSQNGGIKIVVGK
ncbi:hypothetical protein [Neobacillus sp. NPDC093127]|uniref:hypothetical protein n=1 Tax=Neobacillus sp. NPDC093127 TaxID=3364296 RepID=UPI0037FC7179